MDNNNILNFQDSTTILNAWTKKWMHHMCCFLNPVLSETQFSVIKRLKRNQETIIFLPLTLTATAKVDNLIWR